MNKMFFLCFDVECMGIGHITYPDFVIGGAHFLITTESAGVSE